MSALNEPTLESLPSLLPSVLCGGQCVALTMFVTTRSSVSRLTPGRHPKQRRYERLQFAYSQGNHARATDEITDEAVEIVDETLLVPGNGSRVGLLQLQVPADSGHECLGILSESLEYTYKVTQCLVDLGI